MLKAAEIEKPTKRAVIDIGSNSVRLVIYDGSLRAPATICNEKALCGLGRGLERGGSLDPNAVDHALSTLRRFRVILDAHGAPPVRTIATAAVREASNGDAFVRRINDIGLAPEVIGGEREAELAALGVVSYNPQANGLVGDMGGGSLELIALSDGKLGKKESLSIGPLRLMSQSDGDIQQANSIVEQALSGDCAPLALHQETLYAVGGAWRAVAKIHMRLKSYPLSVLHHYELSSSNALEICDLIARQSKRSLEEIPGIPKRRIDTLPYAALVLRAIIKKIHAKRMVISAGGVREGLIFEGLGPKERKLDPLMEGANFFAQRLSPNANVSAGMQALTDQLFPEEDFFQRRLRHVICTLCDIGAFFHPDLRGSHAFDTALRAPFYSISHSGRVAIALALFVRHQGRRAEFPDNQAIGLLSWEEQLYAARIGLALRFASALAPKAPTLLEDCTLTHEGGAIVFKAPKAIETLMEEFPRRRLQSLADSFEAEAVEIYTD